MRILKYYLHGLLFAISAPISAYMTTPNVRIHAHPNSIWGSVFVCVGFFLVTALVIFLLTRDHLSAGMVASFTVLGILYTRDLFLPLVLIIISTSAVLIVVRKTLNINQVNTTLMMLSFAMSVYFGGQYILFAGSAPWDMREPITDPIEITTHSQQEQTKPDVYYIVLDAYGGGEMLEKLHGFDNSEFIAALEERGFVVLSNAKSNYTRTIHSVGSALNLQYLDRVEDVMGDSILWWPLTGMFKQNETRAFLESQGYQTAGVASGWSFTSLGDTSYYSQPYPVFLNEFEEFFYQNTNLSLLGFLGKYGVSVPSYDTHRKIVLNEFQQLDEISTLQSPKFTLIHIISPHPPFVFDSEGNPINPSYPYTIADNRYLITPPSKYEQGYLDQLSFVNTRVILAVDAILENSQTPPIIIIQGDHGPGNFIDANTLTPPCFYERYSILNAYYLPGVDRADIPQDITPVNTFRMVFNYYFSADLEFLPNQQYFSLPETVHQFVDVSDRIDDACVFPLDSNP